MVSPAEATSRSALTQVRSKQRVRDLAEVYTHEREVTAMLDLIPDMFPAGGSDLRPVVERKFLEPACGSGNFLEEILRRKLVPIQFNRIRAIGRYEHWLLRALASIYAVDIDAGNVAESQERLMSVLRSHYDLDANSTLPTPGFFPAAAAIVGTNILVGDTLRDATKLEMVDYHATKGHAFVRTWSLLDDSERTSTPLDLFSFDVEEKKDTVPVHYSLLADTPGPVRPVMGA